MYDKSDKQYKIKSELEPIWSRFLFHKTSDLYILSQINLGGRSIVMKKIGRPKSDNYKDCVCTIRMNEQTMN